ncbi:MAG: energy transducer TonB, partial [Verrucomicrobia bacterium]|nr:energy transducer TonB [Verrucomicrobiota bacterium]
QTHKSLLSACLVSFCMAVAPGVVIGIENFESLKVLEMVLPSYPMKMTFEGIYEGSARVIINVDETGELVDVYQESYTHPEFGRLADKYIRLWTFQPAKLNGEPITAIKPVDFNFDDKRGVYSVGIQAAMGSNMNFGRSANSKRVYSPEELDENLEPIEMVQPPFPEEFRNTDIEGTATVLFYIDETGKTRMPHVTEYSHMDFGTSALLAVENWKFKPPLVRGKPVSIMVSQKFNFTQEFQKIE